MTAAPDPGPPVEPDDGSDAPVGGEPAWVPPEDRGVLTVAKRVVEKVVVQLATELTGTGEGRRRFSIGSDATARADVTLSGARAWVVLEVGLPYPAPFRAAADALRAEIETRVEQLTGIGVERLDLQVGWLDAAGERRRRPA